MKTLVLLVLCVVILGGCNSYVSTPMIDKANDVCEKNMGLKYFAVSSATAMYNIYCNNGAVFYLNFDNVNKEVENKSQ